MYQVIVLVSAIAISIYCMCQVNEIEKIEEEYEDMELYVYKEKNKPMIIKTIKTMLTKSDMPKEEIKNNQDFYTKNGII